MTGARRMAFAAFAAALLTLCVPAPASAAFRDTPDGAWYAAAVAELQSRGFVGGYADGTFRPANPVTAAQFVAIAARCAGLPPVAGGGAHWAADTMRAALQAGWYDWDELPPTGERFDSPIRRVLAVKILMKALLPDMRGDYLTESRKIRDFAALDGRYYESVFAAYASGVVMGDGSGDFRPDDGLTRAAACALICRALRIAESAPAPESAANPAPAPEKDVAPPTPETESAPATATPEAVPDAQAAVSGGVSQNGWLQVRGAQLCNEAGEAVVLRGMSSHGLQWFGQYASAQALRNAAAWGANLFRAAMYTAEGGYLSQPDAMRQKAVAAADAAIQNDMYVILDWHILSDGNPMSHADEAAAFFADMAARYADCPAVLYEICNEPNGGVTWERDIKPYAERMVGVIRERSPRAVILIGSGTWSQDIHIAAQSPLDGENLMYTLHFYAGTHGAELRRRLRDAVSDGLPVFVSEWGTSRADGGGGTYPEESAAWLDLLDELRISWANWSLCDKGEASAALLPGTNPDAVWTEDNLSASGKIVFSRLNA